MRAHRRDWTWALAGVLFSACVVVPCVFTTRLDAVFVVPKLAVLWAALAVGLGIVAVGVAWIGPPPRRIRALPAVDLSVAAFVLLSVTAWAFSTDREQSLYGERLQHQGLLTVLLYVGFFYLARLAIDDGRRLRLFFWSTAIGATLVSGYALVQRVGLDPVWDGYLPGGRVFSSIGQANALAAYLVLTIPVSAALVFGGTLVRRAVLLLAVVSMAAAFALSRSRGGYLGLLAALPVLAIGWLPLRRAGTKRARRWTVVALAVVATIVVAGATVSERERISRDDPSIRFHLDAWRVAIQVAAEHPALGTGPETFPDVFPHYSHTVLPPERAEALDAFRVESPHNVYLGVAAGSGIPALLAYVALIGSFIVLVARAARSATREVRVALYAVLAAVAGHLVTDAFMSAEVTSTWLFWVIMGAGLGVVSQSSRHSSTFQVTP